MKTLVHSDSPPIQATIGELVNQILGRCENVWRGVLFTSVTSRVLANVDGGGGQAEEEAERSDDLGGVHFD